jgi:hypothetical protein
MFVPIGVDCGNADFLKKRNLRQISLPFDWVVTYNGVSEIIKNDFSNYISNNKFNNNYDVYFMHNDFTNLNDKTTMERRINRFKHILETSNEKITFVRKGHAFHHHEEINKHKNNSNCIIKSDITDAKDLDLILQHKYPNLNYEIIVILVCGKCFDSKKEYISTSNNIKIYNISSPHVDNEKYNNLCLQLF